MYHHKQLLLSWFPQFFYIFEFVETRDQFWDLISLFYLQIHFFECGDVELAHFSHLFSWHSLAVFEFKTKLIYEIHNEGCLSVRSSLSHICNFIIIRIINDFLDFLIEYRVDLYVETPHKLIESYNSDRFWLVVLFIDEHFDVILDLLWARLVRWVYF